MTLMEFIIAKDMQIPWWKLWPVYFRRMSSDAGNGAISAVGVVIPILRRGLFLVRCPWLKRPCLRATDMGGEFELPAPPENMNFIGQK
jgi:hypothetical protein